MNDMGKANRAKTLEALIVFGVCLCAFLPFIENIASLRRFFWFGDELHLLLELHDQGMTRWAFNTFAENFVPLFKLMWGSLVWLSNGSYFGVLTVVWCTHALTVAIFYLTMRAARIDMRPAFAASVTLGLTWSNIETLVWSVQWSAMLSILFFLLAANVYLRFFPAQSAKKSIHQLMWVFVLIGAATLCFSKGVINALGFSIATLVMAAIFRSGRRWNISFACAVLLPALIVAALIFQNSTGNHHKLSGGEVNVLSKMAQYGLYYFACNPLAGLFNYSIPAEGGPGACAGFLIVKCLCIAYVLALRSTLENTKTFFLVTLCLVVDLLTSFFIGVGRFHEGLPNTISSRYQYSSLVSFAPFLFISLNGVFDAALKMVGASARPVATVIKVVALVALCTHIYGPWKREMLDWSTWRGIQGRNLFFHGEVDPKRPPQYGVWIGLPPMVSLEQGQMLVREYNLH